MVIITALKVGDVAGSTVIDETTAFASVLFLVSCVFAYFSLRKDTPRTGLYRNIADYSFIAGILLLA